MDSVSTKHIFDPLMELRPWRAFVRESLSLRAYQDPPKYPLKGGSKISQYMR